MAWVLPSGQTQEPFLAYDNKRNTEDTDLKGFKRICQVGNFSKSV
jgi:hypothetical protein